MLGNLVLLAGSIVLSMLAVEMGIRLLYGAPPQWRVPQSRHERVSYGYKLVPDQTSYTGGAAVTANAHGFRGPTWQIPKPPGVYRVMVLGDSLSFGNLVAYEDTFAARLQEALSRRRPGVEVILTAIGGWDTAQELAFLEQEGLHYEPDAVVLGFFHNDYRTAEDSRRALELTPEGRVDERPRSLRWVPYRLVYAVKRSALVSFVRSRLANYLSGRGAAAGPDFPTALLDNRIPLETSERITAAHQAIARMQELCASRGVRLLVAHVPPVNLFWYPRGTRAYVTHLRRFCAERGIEFLDLSERFWQEERTNRLYMYPWDNHLSPRGHAVAAEALAGVLGPWLEASPGTAPAAPSASDKLVPGIAPSRDKATSSARGRPLHHAPGTGIEPPGRVTAAGLRRAMPATTEAGS